MSFKPPKPITKQPIPEGYDAQLYGWIEHLEAQEKTDVLKLLAAIKKVAGGGGGASNSSVSFIEVVSATGNIYTVNVYSDSTYTGTPTVGMMQVMDMALASYLAVGQRYVAPSIAVAVTGGDA